jgi:hypothetical protein
MRPNWIIILALLTALTSVMTDLRASISSASDQVTFDWTYKNELVDEALPLSSERIFKESNLIAQGFIPIVVIADEYDHNHHFAYYLPFYNLNRPKDFFLLI